MRTCTLAVVAVVGIGERTAVKKGNAHGTKVAGRDLSKVHYRDRFPYHDGAPFDIQSAPIPAVGTSERHGHGGTSGLHFRESANPLQQLLEEGRVAFRGSCSLCHGIKGEGGRGPDLTIGVYSAGDSDADLYKVISNGVTGTEMPGYETAGQIKAMPPCKAAVEEHHSCYSIFTTSDGKKFSIGSPAATREVVQFLQSLKTGQT